MPSPPPKDERGADKLPKRIDLPRPTLHFRLKAWRDFQRALDPLGPPKPLRRPPR
jgi:hypothetical protein